MTNAIIFTRVNTQNSNIDTKIDKLINYCCDNKLSIIKEYTCKICRNRPLLYLK